MRRLLLVLLLVGCRDSVVGPDPPEIDLTPRIAGTWTGTFDGRLGVVGVPPVVGPPVSVLRDTFVVTFDVRRVGDDFGYTGRVQRGASGATDLYDCSPEPVTVDLARQVSMPCVLGTQLGEALVFRVEAQADTAFQSLTGTVLDVYGVGESYPITLTRAE